jgi:hypothetical protein
LAAYITLHHRIRNHYSFHPVICSWWSWVLTPDFCCSCPIWVLDKIIPPMYCAGRPGGGGGEMFSKDRGKLKFTDNFLNF